MSADLDLVLNKVKELKGDDLLTVLEEIVEQLRHEKQNNTNKRPTKYRNGTRSPASSTGYRPTSEEIEADLAEIFTPEELAEMEKVDLSKLPQWQGQKSLSEMINEDREDRF